PKRDRPQTSSGQSASTSLRSRRYVSTAAATPTVPAASSALTRDGRSPPRRSPTVSAAVVVTPANLRFALQTQSMLAELRRDHPCEGRAAPAPQVGLNHRVRWPCGHCPPGNSEAEVCGEG